MSDAPVRVLVTHPGASLYGSDRMLLEALRGMVDSGLRPVLVVPGTGPLVGQAQRLGVPVLVRPVPVLRKSALSAGGGLALAARSLGAAVRDTAALRRWRPDVVYVNTVTTPTWVVLAAALGIPVVCHVHEAEGDGTGLVPRLLTAPLLACTRLLVNSEYSRSVLLRSWPRLRDRSRVVRNGVPAPRAEPPRTGGGPLRLLYVGRISERKGVLVALDALERVLCDGVDAHLDLVGDVFAEHAAFARRLQERLRASGLSERTTFHGFVDDVAGHLARCDVLLVPSVLPEPFGNAAVEGVLAGRPVVASAVGGLPEAVAGVASARLVPPGDAAALAGAVVEVAASLPALRGTALREAPAAAERWSPQRFRATVAESLREVTR